MIKRCNDFGAGGVSVAIGELADGLLGLAERGILLNVMDSSISLAPEGIRLEHKGSVILMTDDGVMVAHGLTQEELAQLVGASRETVNKALATFAQRGWIRLEGKSVLIVDTEHLARRAR